MTDKHHALLEEFAPAVAGAGPLAGWTIVVKDNILIKGQTASSSSRMLANYRASYDATVIEKLRAAGASFIGRTNMDEFAMGSSTENSAYGPTQNPRDPARVPGGSSGGSAAAVAAGLARAALGSDTAGSIRQPASFCGVVGLKPTYGAVSRYGLMALTSSLDTIGPLTTTVADAKTLFEVIRGRDPRDATSLDAPAAPEVKARMRIGVPRAFVSAGVAPAVLAAFESSLQKLAAAGHEIVDIELPAVRYALPAYYVLTPAEASTNLARYDGVRYGHVARGANLLEDYKKSRSEGFGPEPRRRIMLGTYVLSAGYYDAYYGQAVALMRLIRREVDDAFTKVDAITTPTAPTTAFRFGEKTADPVAMYLADVFTVPANLARGPAISVPAGVDGDNLPIGFQLMAPHWGEERLFALGRIIEGAA